MKTPTQVLHSQPSCPTVKVKPLRLGGTPRGIQMGLGRNTIQEVLSLAALGTELLPQPLAQSASSPEGSVAVRWLHPHPE